MYGVLKKGTPVSIEVHQDITTLADSLGYHRKTVSGWMAHCVDRYETDAFIITDNVETFMSRRGLPKGVDPRSNRG